MTIYVRADGCVRLGSSATCDGFERDIPLRIQSHSHHDHLKDFERSKGQQYIVLSQGTLDLLIAEFDADLPERVKTNLLVSEADGVFRPYRGVEIALYPSGHIVGGVMPVVRDDVEGTIAYSSDFSWPLARVPQGVDTLVVDATYGDPALVRNYTQEDVIDEFLNVVRDELRERAIVFTGHRGRLQYAAQILRNGFELPFIFTRHAYTALDVFMRYRGFHLSPLMFNSPEAQDLIGRRERCFIFAEQRDRVEIDQLGSQRRVYLSPYMVPRERPIAVYPPFIRVALTDHADFTETVEFIKAVGPSRVIADGTRGGQAEALAAFVSHEVGIPADASAVPTTRDWGRG